MGGFSIYTTTLTLNNVFFLPFKSLHNFPYYTVSPITWWVEEVTVKSLSCSHFQEKIFFAIWNSSFQITTWCRLFFFFLKILFIKSWKFRSNPRRLKAFKKCVYRIWSNVLCYSANAEITLWFLSLFSDNVVNHIDYKPVNKQFCSPGINSMMVAMG